MVYKDRRVPDKVPTRAVISSHYLQATFNSLKQEQNTTAIMQTAVLTLAVLMTCTSAMSHQPTTHSVTTRDLATASSLTSLSSSNVKARDIEGHADEASQLEARGLVPVSGTLHPRAKTLPPCATPASIRALASTPEFIAAQAKFPNKGGAKMRIRSILEARKTLNPDACTTTPAPVSFHGKTGAH